MVFEWSMLCGSFSYQFWLWWIWWRLFLAAALAGNVVLVEVDLVDLDVVEVGGLRQQRIRAVVF